MYELPIVTINGVGNLLPTSVYNEIQGMEYDWDTHNCVLRFKNEQEYLKARQLYNSWEVNEPQVEQVKPVTKTPVKHRLF